MLVNVNIGVINNSSSESAGAQQWWTGTIPNGGYILKAGTYVWIGGYCNQGTMFSTYDTSPSSWVVNMGTSGPKAFSGGSNIGQGPVGGYCTYTKLVYGNSDTMGSGSSGSGILSSSNVTVQGSLAELGSGYGGLAQVNAVNLGNLTTVMGNGMRGPSGLTVVGTKVLVPKVWIWR